MYMKQTYGKMFKPSTFHLLTHDYLILQGDIVYLKDLQIKGFEMKTKLIVYLRTVSMTFLNNFQLCYFMYVYYGENNMLI